MLALVYILAALPIFIGFDLDEPFDQQATPRNTQHAMHHAVHVAFQRVTLHTACHVASRADAVSVARAGACRSRGIAALRLEPPGAPVENGGEARRRMKSHKLMSAARPLPARA